LVQRNVVIFLFGSCLDSSVVEQRTEKRAISFSQKKNF
jgi:hypothetical protein